MSNPGDIKLSLLQEEIGYPFKDTSILLAALTHTSFVKGDGRAQIHNERLEFLGDAVLELCITEQLYKRYPDWNEGALTRARARIVCEPSLYAAAREIGLQNYLRLGHGEEITGGRDKPSILSDALEALIGAIYLDGGFVAARAFILTFAEQMLMRAEDSGNDYKSKLQEYVQKRHVGLLHYRLIEATGPDHKKQFKMHAVLNDELIGEGTGSSKQEAGQQAAREALRRLHAD